MKRSTTLHPRSHGRMVIEKRLHVAVIQIANAIAASTTIAQIAEAACRIVRDTLRVDWVWMLYPADPEAAAWEMLAQADSAEMSNQLTRRDRILQNPATAAELHQLLQADGPVAAFPIAGDPLTLSLGLAPARSVLRAVVRPDEDRPWLMSLHQHGQRRLWTQAERRFLTDVITILAPGITRVRLNERTNERLRQAMVAFENTIEGIVITNAQEQFLAVNRAFSTISGYSEVEALGQTPRLLQSGLHDADFYTELWDTVRREGRWQGEIWNRRKNGEIYPEWLTISSVYDSVGEVINYIGVFTDISQLKHSEEKLAYLAHYDPLTGLPNRLLLYSRLEHALEQMRRFGQMLAVLFIDLDRFKNVNDSLGHPAGDDLLKAIAKRLGDRVRRSDTLARLGGDEFVIVLEKIHSSDEVATVAQQLLELLAQPFVLSSGHEVYVDGSIGISIAGSDTIDAVQLIRNADTAMYQAKTSGGGMFRFYNEMMTQALNERLDLESKLRRALERQELKLYYQPQVDTTSGAIIGLEALARWEHPELGNIVPARFIPIAEETGLIAILGEWSLRTACFQIQVWREQGLIPPRLAVNLSPRQFHQQRLPDLVGAILLETGLPADWLELEITESTIMHQPEQAEATLRSLKQLGVRLAVDDFGTGYSSLSYLQRFALDRLKIDRSFISELPHKHGNATIVAAIIAMAHNLNLEVLAEGVETADQLELLSSYGCESYQGYYYSYPLNAEAIGYLLAQQR